jgi:catechol 2,3-dioxygenase-like lactoylglutathione lyase family enzyme
MWIRDLFVVRAPMPIVASCIWLAVATAFAQPATDPTPAATAFGAFFALTVPDIDASARWYSEKLGLAVTMRDTGPDKTRVVVLEGGGLIVELIQRPDAGREKSPAAKGDDLPARGFFKGGAIVTDFDRTLATLRARGVEIAFGPYPAKADQRANVIIRDNAGNLIQFFGKYAEGRTPQEASLAQASADVEAFVQQVLDERFSARDIPDLNLLGSSKTITVRQEMPQISRRLSQAALPKRDGYQFVLAPSSDIQAEANRTQRFVYYIWVDQAIIMDDAAKIAIGVDFVMPAGSTDVKLCCCDTRGYFQRRDNRWRVLQWTVVSCS